MTPSEVTNRLNRIVAHKLKLAVMLWGAPGIGKSSVVQQVAQAHDLELIDLRLSQLAPTDLRGLPVPEDGLAKWFPPEFLPRNGQGILFLDELNLAPPAIQGIAQQLVLDRKVGSYCYDDQTRVMTRSGLKLFRDLTSTDEVMTLNPATNQVEYHVPSNHIALQYKGDMHHFQGKGISLRVSPDHSMFIRTDWETAPRFRKAHDLAKLDPTASYHYRVKRSGDWTDNGPKTFCIPMSKKEKARHAIHDKVMALRKRGITATSLAKKIGVTKTVIEGHLYNKCLVTNSYNQNRSFDVDDWAEFMGWFVTEGSTQKVHNYRIFIAQDKIANPEKYARILALLKRMKFSVQEESKGLKIYSAALYEYLEPLGRSKVRFIPPEVKNLPKHALKRLLEAVLLGDGSDDRRIFTASSALRDDYAEIALKLGYGVTFKWREGSGYATAEQGSWLIGLSRLQVESGISKIETSLYDGTIYCVTVQNHIIMVERDGKLSWCGNCVPPNWFIWAAGNRREDAAAVAEMPAPLANRFAHLEVNADLASLTAYALGAGWHSDIIGFLNFMPAMLHALDKKAHAWPSPRSWDMAGQLMSAGVSVSHAVGDTAGHAFEAYQAVCAHLPDTDAIRAGRSNEPYPAKRELQFAVTTKLAFSITDAQQLGHSVTWVKNPELQQYLVAARLSSFKPDERNRFLGSLRSVNGQFPQLQQLMLSARELLEELR